MKVMCLMLASEWYFITFKVMTALILIAFVFRLARTTDIIVTFQAAIVGFLFLSNLIDILYIHLEIDFCGTFVNRIRVAHESIALHMYEKPTSG